MRKLTPKEFAKARHLFRPWDYRVYAEAVISGASPGELYVDDPDHPSAALMATLEPYLLVGSPENPQFKADLKVFLGEIMTQRTAFNGGDGLFVSVYPEDWTVLLDETYAAAGRSRIVDKRRHYICRQVPFDWRAKLPEGYTIRRVNAELLAKTQLAIPAEIPGWATYALANCRDRLANGFGACALYGPELVCWSLLVCIGGDRCELLIDTTEAHRRRGLATATAAALVEFCLADGFSSVGWDCSEYNIPSWRTAERAGFHLVRRDAQHYCMFDEAFHWSETGWIAFREGRYQETVEAYEKAFALNPAASAQAYSEAAEACARLGDTQKAEYYRRRAI
jgi:RimJ/RimL family protein N-acetyltransferase